MKDRIRALLGSPVEGNDVVEVEMTTEGEPVVGVLVSFEVLDAIVTRAEQADAAEVVRAAALVELELATKQLRTRTKALDVMTQRHERVCESFERFRKEHAPAPAPVDAAPPDVEK